MVSSCAAPAPDRLPVELDREVLKEVSVFLELCQPLVLVPLGFLLRLTATRFPYALLSDQKVRYVPVEAHNRSLAKPAQQESGATRY